MDQTSNLMDIKKKKKIKHFYNDNKVPNQIGFDCMSVILSPVNVNV